MYNVSFHLMFLAHLATKSLTVQTSPLARNVCFQGDQATGLGAQHSTLRRYISHCLDTLDTGIRKQHQPMQHEIARSLPGMTYKLQVRHTKKNSATKPTAGVSVVISHLRYQVKIRPRVHHPKKQELLGLVSSIHSHRLSPASCIQLKCNAPASSTATRSVWLWPCRDWPSNCAFQLEWLTETNQLFFYSAEASVTWPSPVCGLRVPKTALQYQVIISQHELYIYR